MMNDFGPAFPQLSQWDDKTLSYTHTGMSLRDYFAAAALPVMWGLTQFALQSNIEGTGKLTLNDGEKVNEDMLAKGAYAIADAMLKASAE